MSEQQKFDKELNKIVQTFDAVNGKSETVAPTDGQLKESAKKYRERFDPKITVLTPEQAAKINAPELEVDHIRKSANFAKNHARKESKKDGLDYETAKAIFWNCFKSIVLKETTLKPEVDKGVFSNFPNIVRWGIDDISGTLNPYKSLYIWGGLGIGKSTIAHALSLMTAYNAINFKFNSKKLSFISMDEFFLKILESESLTGLSDFSKESAIVIDELRDKHFKYKHYGNEINLVAEILSARHSLWKRVGVQTVITSNIPKDLLREELNDDRLFDRILQQYEFIEIEGSNKRRIENNHK